MTASPDYIRGQRDGMERAARIVECFAAGSLPAAAIRAEKAKLPDEPTEAEVDAKLDANTRSLRCQIQALEIHIERQGHMLDQASTLLDAAATVAKEAQDEAGSFHEKLDRAEAELVYTRKDLIDALAQRDKAHVEIQRQAFGNAFEEAIQPKDKRATRDQIEAEIDKLINEAARTNLHGRDHERFARAYAALNWASDHASFDPVSKP